MEKIIFEDLPSTNTPINAENLNKIQENVENEINNKFKYSTEEQIIGTWIDGKPLYRKKITITEIGTGTSLNIENMENIFIDATHSYIYWNNDYVFPIDRAMFILDKITGTIKSDNPEVSDWKSSIIIEYTKTTD